MNKTPQYSITHANLELKCLSSKDRKDQILQYNLDQNLLMQRWRYTGSEPKTTTEFEQLLSEIFSNHSVLDICKISGSQSGLSSVNASQLKLSVMSMEFFDKLENSDVVGSGGQIKGCFDETFEGITIGDKLREMLLNELSDNLDLFSPDEKSELIFHLFKTVAVGGALCQPDSSIERYLELTKDLYKELVTIYRDSKTDTVQFSGKVFRVDAVAGLELFPDNPNCPLNSLIVIIDVIKKTFTIVKNSFKPFW